MEKQIVIGITLILLAGGLSGCIDKEYRVIANKLDEEPSTYENISEEQMESYPKLKEAIVTGEPIQLARAEFNNLADFLFGGKADNMARTNIKYQNEYYQIKVQESM